MTRNLNLNLDSGKILEPSMCKQHEKFELPCKKCGIGVIYRDLDQIGWNCQNRLINEVEASGVKIANTGKLSESLIRHGNHIYKFVDPYSDIITLDIKSDDSILEYLAKFTNMALHIYKYIIDEQAKSDDNWFKTYLCNITRACYYNKRQVSPREAPLLIIEMEDLAKDYVCLIDYKPPAQNDYFTINPTFIYDIIIIIIGLSQHRFYHNDLHFGNIFIKKPHHERASIKLIDFDLSTRELPLNWVKEAQTTTKKITNPIIDILRILFHITFTFIKSGDCVPINSYLNKQLTTSLNYVPTEPIILEKIYEDILTTIETDTMFGTPLHSVTNLDDDMKSHFCAKVYGWLKGGSLTLANLILIINSDGDDGDLDYTFKQE